MRGYGRLGGRPFTLRQHKGAYSTVGVESGLSSVCGTYGRPQKAGPGGSWQMADTDGRGLL